MTRAAAMWPMDQAAAAGRVALQRCGACGAGQYPPRELCRTCLADALAWTEHDSVGGELLAVTAVHHTNDPAFRGRLPLPVGLVRIGDVTAVCFVAAGLAPPAAVQVRAAADERGPPC